MNVKNHPNTLELINSNNEKISFPIPENTEEVKQVVLNGRKLDINVALELAEVKDQGHRSTREIIRRFGVIGILVTVIGVGVGSYTVHMVHRELNVLNAIHTRLAGVGASKFRTGQMVRFKSIGFDRNGANMVAAAINSLSAGDDIKAKMSRLDFVECRGEVLEHWQTEEGVWYASIALDSVLLPARSRGEQGGKGLLNQIKSTSFKSMSPVVFRVPETRLKTAGAQKNESFL